MNFSLPVRHPTGELKSPANRNQRRAGNLLILLSSPVRHPLPANTGKLAYCFCSPVRHTLVKSGGGEHTPAERNGGLDEVLA